MRKNIAAKALVTVALIATFATPVFADAIDNTIKARQAYFKLLSFNFGQLVAMAKGEAGYDAEVAGKAAKNLQALAHLDIGPLFVAGSDNVAKKGATRALPKIWEDFPGVIKITDEWKAAVDVLATSAQNGKESLAPAVGAVGKQCGACHETYRAKDF